MVFNQIIIVSLSKIYSGKTSDFQQNSHEIFAPKLNPIK